MADARPVGGTVPLVGFSRHRGFDVGQDEFDERETAYTFRFGCKAIIAERRTIVWKRRRSAAASDPGVGWRTTTDEDGHYCFAVAL